MFSQKCLLLELITFRLKKDASSAKQKFSYFCIFIQTFYTITYIVLSHNRADAKCSLHNVQRRLSTRLTYKSNQTNTLCMHTTHKHTETIKPTCVIGDIKQVNDISNRSGICSNNTIILSSNEATHPVLTCLHQRTR